jgi:cell wall-associated NlpC family hydrolase
MSPLSRAGSREDGSASLGVVIGAAIAALVLLIPLLISIGSSSLSTAASACTPAGTTQPQPSAAASSIPGTYLALFQKTGGQYGIPWTVLAGIGKVETDDGANDGPSSAGALGPMQFLPSTWAIYGDGGNIMNPAAAIPAAARLLLANGAPANIPAAIFAYNHAPDYVTEVLNWASTYAAGGYTVSASQQASCTLAAVHQAPSTIAAQIITFAMAQIGKPYQWGATGPDAYDCSGLIYAAYRSVGITLPRTTFGMWDLTPHIPEGQAEPGDIVFFNTGPGTAPDHPGHAGLVIGNGQMVVASCATCGPISTTSYLNNPTLVGFVRPLADPAIVGQAADH